MTAASANAGTEESVVDRATRVIREVVVPAAPAHDRTGEFPVANFAALGREGLMGMFVPRAYGGLQASHETFVRVVEELGAACASTAMMYVMHHNQYIMVVEHGTDRQREFFLPPVARGESLFASGTTEPGTGGNADHCVSARVRDGDDFVVSATKPVVSGANHARWVCVTTRTAPDAPSNALSMMIMPGAGSPGVRPFGVWDCVGMRATGSSGLAFEECRVPAWHQIGPDIADEVRATSMAPVAVVGFSAAWMGIAEAAMRATVGHLTHRQHQFIKGDERKESGPREGGTFNVQVHLSDYESVQRQVAEMRAKVEAARALVRAAARMMDSLKPGPTQAIPRAALPPLLDLLWSARIISGETAVDVCRMALRVCGVAGMRPGGLPLERHMRDALTAQVMAPSEDLTKIFLGRKTLGLPPR